MFGILFVWCMMCVFGIPFGCIIMVSRILQTTTISTIFRELTAFSVSYTCECVACVCCMCVCMCVLYVCMYVCVCVSERACACVRNGEMRHLFDAFNQNGFILFHYTT